MKILITGATGFIGSNIVIELLNRGHQVFATHRNSSSFEKCISFRDKIEWINSEKPGWKEYILKIKPQQLIHTAWAGINAEERNNWELQIRNFWLSKEYFDMAKTGRISKVIALGSQAEYGKYNYPADETTVPKPDDAYGAVKTLCANYLRNICEETTTDWYWIRVFAIFGENDNSEWLIPSVISKLIRRESIQLTSCEQQYNYLYLKDFVSILLSIIEFQGTESQSGIYNVCNNKSIVLKDLLVMIAEYLNTDRKLLEFGALPYRNSQNMFIAGDNSKAVQNFALKNDTLLGISKGLKETINHHKQLVQ